MESFGNIFEEDQWHSLDRMFITDENSDDQFAKHGLMSSPCDFGLNFKSPNMFLNVRNDSSNVDLFVRDDQHIVNVSDDINPNFYHFLSQENSISSTDISPNVYYFLSSNVVPQISNDVCDQSIECHTMNEINNSSMINRLFSEENHYLTQDVALVSSSVASLKRKLEFPDVADYEVTNEKTDKNSKKRIRVSRDNNDKKDVQPKKNQKKNDTEDKNKKNHGEMNGQSSSSCSSNDDLNLSQDLNGADNTNGKTRASRGNATDPQSLYARKRRERINERLRILQNLVPNGTKVDISTMLEEAVEYVKFLKLQIKLLSSDDMWMYAPIAYNGMDMGLYQNISQNLRN
ncbi:hypothetical protein R6Q57_018439 [Mikania cordata]